MEDREDNWIEFRGTLVFRNTSIPSVNNTYKLNYKTRSMYKHPDVASYQDSFVLLAITTDLVKIREFRDKWAEVRVEFHFYLPPSRKFWSCDVSNMVKASEDALSEVTLIDDSKHKSVYAEKHISDDKFSRVEVIYKIKKKI